MEAEIRSGEDSYFISHVSEILDLSHISRKDVPISNSYLHGLSENCIIVLYDFEPSKDKADEFRVDEETGQVWDFVEEGQIKEVVNEEPFSIEISTGDSYDSVRSVKLLEFQGVKNQIEIDFGLKSENVITHGDIASVKKQI